VTVVWRVKKEVMVCVAVREVVGAAPAELLAGKDGIGETTTVLGETTTVSGETIPVLREATAMLGETIPVLREATAVLEEPTTVSGETITVLGEATAVLEEPTAVLEAGVWLAVTGQMVVYMAIVEVMVRAGQSLTEEAHWVTVYTVVEKTTEVVYSTEAVVAGTAAAVLVTGRGTMVAVIGVTPLSVTAVAVEISLPIVNDRETLPLSAEVTDPAAAVLLLP
jgi:hypothetical protein